MKGSVNFVDTTEMRVKLVTFASADLGWTLARRRFVREAKSFGFHDVEVFTPSRVKHDFPDFYKRHKSLLKYEPKGAGLWIWKPQIVQNALQNSVGQNCCVIYADIGTTINPSSVAKFRFRAYVDAAFETGGFCFELESQPTAAWISESARGFLGLSERELTENQICATVFGLTSTEENLSLVTMWGQICELDGYEYLKDPSGATNDPRFKAHRHDQAIFSVLARRASLGVFHDETYFHPNWRVDGAVYPFWASRRQSIVSLVERRGRAGLSPRIYLSLEEWAVKAARNLRILRLNLARLFRESM
jgi:hypothetical protein